MEIEGVAGVTIARVVPGSAADRDGLRAGDILLTAGGKPLVPDPLNVLDAYLRTGKAITFELERSGARQTVVVTPNPR